MRKRAALLRRSLDVRRLSMSGSCCLMRSIIMGRVFRSLSRSTVFSDRLFVRQMYFEADLRTVARPLMLILPLIAAFQ